MQGLSLLNWADYTIIAIIVVSTMISLARGFVREIFSLITWVVAFIVAFKFSAILANLFVPYIQTPSVRLAIGFILLFIIMLIVGGILSFLLAQLVTKTGLTGTDRMLGMIFGLVRGVFVVAIILLLISLGTNDHAEWWTKSHFIPYFQDLADWLHRFLPEKFVNFVASS